MRFNTINSLEWYYANKDRARKNGMVARNKIRELRKKILYSLGEKCLKCGFSDERALQIDHVNSGGCREQKKYGTGMKYLNIVSASIFKQDGKYQLLCANCNIIKKFEKNEFSGQLKMLSEPVKEKSLFD